MTQLTPPLADARAKWFTRPRGWMKRARTWLRRRANRPCPRCGYELRRAPLYRGFRVCDNCGHHFPLDAHKRIHTLVDPNSFVEVEKFLATRTREREYARRVREAKRETHLRESVVIGRAKIHEQPVALAVLDFRFLGGTMGAAAGEKIARAFELAAEHKLPLIAITASGGARIQEGMVALMQMAKTTLAATRFQETGRPFITVLSNPTTGGVYASFANLADVILAEPRALIGFAGPRVVEILTRQKLPNESHRAEFLLQHGMVDAIVRRTELRDQIGMLLRTAVSGTSPLTPPSRGEGKMPSPPSPVETHPAQAQQSRVESTRAEPASRHVNPSPPGEGRMTSPLDVWQSVQLARRHDRPTTLDYVQRLFTDFVELHGDHYYGDDPAVVAGVAQFQGQGVVVIGLERGHGDERAKRHEGRAEPEGYRKAERLMRLASKWQLPVITFVDTPGANPSYEAEKRGIAMSLSHCIATMLQTRVPTVSVVIGEGGSGGALALAVADRVLMLEHTVYSVIAPEGASAILFGDDTHAAELAQDLRLTAPDLLERHIIDGIIPEPAGGAHTDWERAAESVRIYLVEELAALNGKAIHELLDARYLKYREMA